MAEGTSATQVLVVPRDMDSDSVGKQVSLRAQQLLDLAIGHVIAGKLYQIHEPVDDSTIDTFAKDALRDPVAHDVYVNAPFHPEGFAGAVIVAKRPGVTDDEGMSAQRALGDYCGHAHVSQEQHVHCQDVYFIEKPLSRDDLFRLSEGLLGNPLVNSFHLGNLDTFTWGGGVRAASAEATVETVDLECDDAALLRISGERHLSLTLAELHAIRDYYRDQRGYRRQCGLSESPTDCELEIIAQSWSEHCKHKEFNALIEYTDHETGHRRTIDSLFKSRIVAATEAIGQRLAAAGHSWLVKVFSDNAGVVAVDADRLFVWKVETHNTPSALDPYGGAITGILGNNRDALGTGVGGARLLFNTNVLCFAAPDYDKPLLRGQLPPQRILQGVVEGIMDGGNKSGVPTVNGSVVFDDRYCGKPLVYCGTGALMARCVAGVDAWTKPMASGDLLVMAGGRVGKDGIHGATLSSSHVDAETPLGAVQIGSPMTQKRLSDFLEQACAQGLVKTCTDNGAGGLSSSIGELAEHVGGAEVYLEKVPLKYSGLLPWEIFVSESQERMTLVVDPADREALSALADSYDVELSFVGQFVASGRLEVKYGDTVAACLELEFLHNGVPRKTLCAEWVRPELQEPAAIDTLDHSSVLLQLMGAWNICSREALIRRYDHEVKGRTVVKPLMGVRGNAPQDAGVVRLSYDGFEGLLVSNGILPRYGDIDAYHASAGAFDEAVRQIIAVGGELPDLTAPSSSFWSVNDNFCVPNCAYHPDDNPDGKYKLAQLVRMCDALYDMSTAYNVPMTSGKDSMKNDFRDGDKKISVPPTILYSMVSQIDDIRRVTTTEFKRAGDTIYLIGQTYDELGGSEFYKLFDLLGANVPVVRPQEAIRRYRLVAQAHRERLLVSCHDCSDGGLAVALAECALGGELGMDVAIPNGDYSVAAALYSESHSRFVVSVAEESRGAFEALMGDDAVCLGAVTEQPRMVCRSDGTTVIDVGIEELLKAWKGGLVF